MNPKVSVLMSCYNAEKFVAETIESILCQSFKNFEFIIMDDASTDNSSEIIKSFDDPRIVYMRNEKNLKLVKSLNIGLELARGEYIARTDADDISLPTRLEKQVAFMDNHPDVGLLGAWAETLPDCSSIKFKEEVNYFDMLKKNCLVSSSTMMRKSVLDKYSLQHDEDYMSAEDYELWSRMIRYVKVANLPEILLKYRVHKNSLTFTMRREQEGLDRQIKQNMLSFLTDRRDLKCYFISVLDLISFPVIKIPVLYGAHGLKLVMRSLKRIFFRLKSFKI